MIIERDVSDQGLSPVDERSAEERAAEARRLRMAPHLDPGPGGPPAKTRQRGRAINQARRECRWTRPSSGKKLLTHCPRCRAGIGQWCLVAGQSKLGRICSERPAV